MYAIASKESAELAYWNGGMIFSVYPEDAARFVKEVDAEDTIPILLEAGFAVDIHVVELPEDDLTNAPGT